MRSLRRTLSVRFSLTMFAALLVIALWAFLGARTILRRELDRGLVAAAHLESAILAAGLAPAPHLGEQAFEAFVQDVNRFVAVRDPTGAILVTNTPHALELPLDPAALASAAGGRTTWSSAEWTRGEVRSVYLDVAHDAPGDPRVVQVAASLGPIDAAGRHVLLLMLGTVALGTVATMLGGGWLSKSTVAPVAEIAAQAEAVAPGAVGQRITAHAEVEEFYGLVGVLNRMLERLDRGVLAQRRIIADVGHDLRTPLTAIRGEVEVALRSRRPVEQYERVLRSVIEEVDHLDTISDALLLLARIEAGDLELQRVETDVPDLVGRAVQRAQQRVSDHTIRYRPPADADGTAAVDAKLVSLVVDHLLDNAVRHTPPTTTVTVSVDLEPGAVSLAVEDDGPGVPEDVLPHLFERFYRGESARGRSAGAGLGLTVAAAIVDAHAGTIRAERAARSGLRVTVRVPRTPSRGA